MGKRTVVLVVALLLAAVSTFAVWRYLSTVEDNVKKDIVEVQVYRATQTIETGTDGETARQFIEPSTELREFVVFPGSTILCTGPVIREGQDPDQAEGCPENPSNLDELLDGKVAAGPIARGQLITTEMFVTPAELNDTTLSESIPQGKVAISIRPNEEAAVAGFIRPGDRVNLIASADVQVASLIELLKDPDLREKILGAGLGSEGGTTTGQVDENGEPVDAVAAFAETLPGSLQFTQTVLQDLEVLAVGPDTRPSPLGNGLTPQGTQVIVLEVTPEQAERIEFARQYTSISLSLLPADTPYTPFEARGVVVDDLFSLLDRIVEQVEGALGN